MNTIIAIYKMTDEPGVPSNYSCLCDEHMTMVHKDYEVTEKTAEHECEVCLRDITAQLEAMTIDRNYWRDQYRPRG